MTDLNWQKSTYCGTNACVEIAWTDTAVLMRDSKNPGQEPLAFTHRGWQAFLERVRGGEPGGA